MTETKRLRQIWRQLRDYGSVRGFEMDYKFLRSCVHMAVKSGWIKIGSEIYTLRKADVVEVKSQN